MRKFIISSVIASMLLLPEYSIASTGFKDFTDADALVRQGMTLNGSGHYQEALEAFLQAATVDPNNSFAYFNLGTASALLGRYNEAAGYLREAVRISPDLIPAWNNLGAMYNHLKQPKEALAAFCQVIRLSPNDANAHFQSALALLALGAAAEARVEYGILQRLDPQLAEKLLLKLKSP